MLMRLLFHPLQGLTIAALLAFFPPSAAGAANRGAPDADAYRLEIDGWYQQRLQSLKSPEGYLSLVGLFPLLEGENRFGSAPDNDMVFPSGAPERAGVFVLEDGTVRVDVAEGVEITVNGRAVTSSPLRTDADGGPTVLSMGTLRFYAIDRSGDLYIRVKDLDSDLLKHFAGVERFPVDAAWRIEGRFEAYDPPKPISLPNVLGGRFDETCPGRVVFEVRGHKCSLEPTSTSDGRLFFVFGDATSGAETYGGGRFLVAAAPDEDGTVVLDFNKAYNPPCAFTPYATCPLPHEANRLDVRIEAGEKNWGEGH
jgi:uncharacterized protein (DUF1684 family)